MADNSDLFVVSVLLITYNHEKYVDQALDSLIRQEIKGRIEVVVADDASSDRTREIIRSYEGRDSRFEFKYLDRTKNVGITKNYQQGFAACSGQYIAVLEGDDYWISPHKLRRQQEFLEAHWECDLCSVNYFVYTEDRAQFTPRVAVGQGYSYFSARELIADNVVGNFSTCMYRKSAIEALSPKLFELKSYDWIVNICVSANSLIGFLEQPMSVYRLHSGGVWTQTSNIEKLEVQLAVIPDYDDLTGHVFRAEFNLLSSRLRHLITASKLGCVARPVIPSVSTLTGYLPPVLITIASAIMPPLLKRFLVKLLLWRS